MSKPEWMQVENPYEKLPPTFAAFTESPRTGAIHGFEQGVSAGQKKLLEWLIKQCESGTILGRSPHNVSAIMDYVFEDMLKELNDG